MVQEVEGKDPKKFIQRIIILCLSKILPMSFFNGHTGQTVKQHMNSKNSTHVFLEWTHRTNGQTTYEFKAFYPGVFIMDTQNKQGNNIFIQSILPMSF